MINDVEEAFINSLATLVRHGRRLTGEYHFDWSEASRQSANRLRLALLRADLPPMAAVVGGASSGKSTVFDNLLGGSEASRITARGHATRGPVLAVHEDRQATVRELLDKGLLFPGLKPVTVEMDARTEGDPSELAVLFHPLEALSDVLVIDTPDFTSEAARREGDIFLSLLPWFDRLVIVIDRERWFDRQSISKLRMQSARYGQQRMVVFNRTEEGGPLSSGELDVLGRQADRLATDGMMILEFRRGRGLCRFPPGTLDDVRRFLSLPAPDRRPVLRKVVAEAAGHVLNQNEERHAGLVLLHKAIARSLEGMIPNERECMLALMTPQEREQISAVFRVFRVRDVRSWLANQTRLFESVLKRLPLLGAFTGNSHAKADKSSDDTDLQAAALKYFENIASRQVSQCRRVARSSGFWNEVRSWTGLEPGDRGFRWNEKLKDDIRRDVEIFGASMEAWNRCVDAECKGIGPNVKGAIGAGVLGLAIVLMAAPGPISVLTFAAAKTAVGAALGKLAVLSGAGAVFGKHAGRLVDIVQEKLLGSPEFDAVRRAAGSFRENFVRHGAHLLEETVAEAKALVLAADDPLLEALERLRNGLEDVP